MASELKVDTIKHTNNTSAITLDTSGNVTLAGSANNLGTVSAGTIGSNVTFPAGSVLQVQNVVDQTETSTTSAETWTGLNQSITLKSTDPKILLIYSHTVYLSVRDNAFIIRLKRDTSAITASNFGTQLHASGFVGYSQNSQLSATYVYQYLDTLSASQGSTLYYGTTFSLDYNGYGAPTCYVNYTDSNIDPTSSSLTVMEIKS